jgi:hypothetical protein
MTYLIITCQAAADYTNPGSLKNEKGLSFYHPDSTREAAGLLNWIGPGYPVGLLDALG